jgi:hypothetical protein
LVDVQCEWLSHQLERLVERQALHRTVNAFQPAIAGLLKDKEGANWRKGFAVLKDTTASRKLKGSQDAQFF